MIHQKEQVFAKEKELNAAFRKLEIGRISSEGFRDELRRLGLHETSTLRKVLDEHDLQGGATYKKVLKALYLPDYMAGNEPPVELVVRDNTHKYQSQALPSLDDEVPASPSKRSLPLQLQDTDVLTWTQDPKFTPERRRAISPMAERPVDPIPSQEPIASPLRVANGSGKREFNTAEINEVVRSYLSRGMKTAELQEYLGSIGLKASERLNVDQTTRRRSQRFVQ